MLFYPVGMPKPVRVQGALITDSEVENIVSFIKSRQQAQYDDQIISKIDSHADESSRFWKVMMSFFPGDRYDS